MDLTIANLTELIVTVLLASSVLIGVIAVALRVAVRPLIADWVKMRAEGVSPGLERRLAEMEEDLRQLKAGAGLQLPAESVRSPSRSRT